MSDDYVKSPSAWLSRLKDKISAKEDSLDLESYRSYLKSVVGAFPEIIPPSGATSYSIPAHLSSNMTVEQAGLLLLWLGTYLKSRGHLGATSCFFQNFKETPWFLTEGHGRRRPSSCFGKWSSFSAFFNSSDVPVVDASLSEGYQPTLADLGVITDAALGCDAVVNRMFEISNDATQTYSCDLQQASRLYTYLQKFLWKPAANSPKLKIFVPGTSDTSNAWEKSECCVLHEDDAFFDHSLPVLEELYPRSLLPFFAEVLQVPRQATVERYCQLWLNWRSDLHEITANECTRVWKILSQNWEKCDSKVWKEFVAKAWVASKSEVTGAFQFLSPRTCFIPVDLDLLSLFGTDPEVQFVWYPGTTEQMECAMNKVYLEMGVKNLTECVEADFIIREDSGREVFIQGAGNGILSLGLFRAILGFIVRKKYGLSSSKRQSLLVSLKGVAQISITVPLTRCYRISCISPPVIVTQDNVMALWSKTNGMLYCLDNNSPILGDPLVRRCSAGDNNLARTFVGAPN